jgi:uncharacterized phage protein (TIGR01671 family)
MDREFKFRGWDKLGGMKYFDFSDLVGRYVTIYHGVYDVPIMQFIGLEDCDGRDIYEGDLVSSGAHTIYRVDWLQSHAQYFFKVLKTENVLSKELRFPVWQYAVDGKCAVEVIGNIYESPDLLK